MESTLLDQCPISLKGELAWIALRDCIPGTEEEFMEICLQILAAGDCLMAAYHVSQQYPVTSSTEWPSSKVISCIDYFLELIQRAPQFDSDLISNLYKKQMELCR